MTSHRSSADNATRALVERDANRFEDLRIDLELDGETLLSVGGRWDRRLEDYVDEAETAAVIRMHPGQAAAVLWFRDWITSHAERRDSPPQLTQDEIDSFEIDTDPAHVYSALFAGGRRGGKTWIAIALAVVYAIAFPRAIVWIVSPSSKKHDEVRRYGAGALIPSWLERDTADTWELCNGSRIMLKSGYDPEDLKEGEAHLVILNEGQRMDQRAFVVARGGIVDKAGLVLVCANPPVESGDQPWVSDFAADCQAGKRASVYVEFNPLDNPHIDRRALLSLRFEVDERTFAIEVLGQFRGPKDAVAYNWNRLENERRPGDPFVGRDLVDVTEHFLHVAEEGDGIRQLIGLDVQRFPYIGGPVYRFYAPRSETPTRDNVLAWIVGEVVLEGGDEEDFCAEAMERDYLPDETLIVCDATGEYQHSRRRAADAPKPEWTGRGSFSIIRGAGYRRIVPPSKLFRRKNPELVDRVRAFTSMICNAVLTRRLFADPELAPKTCKAIREWKTVHGKPSRSQEVAHLGDGASYPIVRLFPRILRSGKPGGVDQVTQRVDRSQPSDLVDPRVVTRTPPRRGSRTRGF